MKKLIVLLALMGLPAGLLAQGTLVFQNATSPDTTFQTNNGAGNIGRIDGANQFLVGLYTAPAGTTDESAFILRITATNRTGNFRGTFVNSPVTGITGVPIGQQIAFQVRAWSFANGGASDVFENAPLSSTVYKGKTAIGFVTGGDPAGGTAGVLFGSSAGQIGIPTQLVLGVPEPSSIALGLLGLGAIALFRRRK